LAWAVKAWYDEESKYNYASPGFSGATGHFTQVVWKGSARLGCAIRQCATMAGGRPASFISCHYSPPGNYQGQFPQNVRVFFFAGGRRKKRRPSLDPFFRETKCATDLALHLETPASLSSAASLTHDENRQRQHQTITQVLRPGSGGGGGGPTPPPPGPAPPPPPPRRRRRRRGRIAGL